MRWGWALLCAAALTAAPVELSLKRAVQLAVSPEGNTRVQLSAEALKQAESRSAQSRAALLPDLSAAFTDENATRNLAAQGIQISLPIPGFIFPSFVGPFTDRKSTRLNSSHLGISYAVFCLKKKTQYHRSPNHN